MILDITPLVQQAANMSGLEQTIYQRKDGSYIYCAKGNFNGLKMALKPDEQVSYIGTIKPETKQ